MHSYTDDL
jgi:hypothetical protein